MKYCGLASALLLWLVATAQAQVTVEVTQEQDQFLQGETMPATVRITNLSGQTLHLGADPDWLSFSIASPEGLVVTKTGDPVVVGEFDLESSKVAIKHVDLAPCFTFSHAGRFGIVATLRLKGWGEQISSRPRFFDIIDGAKLWEQTVGMPPAAGETNAPPVARRYTLQQANYLRGQLRLYLKVSDLYGKVVRVCAIGPMVSFGRPQSPQIDRLSNLHVLYQSGATTFSYTVFNPEGELLSRQTYDYGNSRPRLRADSEGNITVFGGVRRITAHDLPPPKEGEDQPTDTTNPTNTAAPAKP